MPYFFLDTKGLVTDKENITERIVESNEVLVEGWYHFKINQIQMKKKEIDFKDNNKAKYHISSNYCFLKL